MALRGALGAGLNTALAIVLLALPAVGICLVLGDKTAQYLVTNILVAYLLGVLAGLPALVLNRMALTELYGALNGRLFLSSQIALFGSWHGKIAVLYFYVVEYLAILSFPSLARVPLLEGVGGFILQAIYLSANVLPFVFPPKRKRC